MSQESASPRQSAAEKYLPARGKRIALCVTGSVAAYKTALLARLLVRAGAEVQVVQSRSSREFVGAATFAGITGRPPLSELFDADTGGELHVELAAESDVVVVMPATADCLARLAAGRADDLVTATVLCATGQVIVAPAMHPNMWSHPATQRSVRQLTEDGRVTWVGPVSGEVASGDFGEGRMAEPEAVYGAIIRQLSLDAWQGRRVLISAGPTVEDVDPVRFISNRSTGKMGFALAERAAARGAEVTLVAGPTELPTPFGVTRVNVRSALEMQAALSEAAGPALSGIDALIMCAAVGDYRLDQAHTKKLSRGGEGLTLELKENPDIIRTLAAERGGKRPVLVAFAVETEESELVVRARTKLEKKGVDLVVANLARDSFGREHNVAVLVSEASHTALPELPKPAVADHLLDWVLARLVGPC